MCQGILKTQINLNSRENIRIFIIHHISQKKYSQFLAVHTSRKKAYTKIYRTKKLNQLIFKSSWVPNLAKCMHVVCETKLWEIWFQKCKIDKGNNVMHVNPNTNDAWKD